MKVVAKKIKTPTPEEMIPETAPKTTPETTPETTPMTIAKPSGFSLDKFKAKKLATVANVETLPSALPVHNMAAAKDFVMLHPDVEAYWSDELCFVSVPIKGRKNSVLHLIDEDIALKFLESGEIQRFRLALATKPYDVLFLCTIPTRNLDNPYNEANLDGCEKAKTQWMKATSRKSEGIESYKLTGALDLDAFPPPNWPGQSLSELIGRTFAGCLIETEDNPALLRKIGKKLPLS
jgi:hypothetical protein